MNLDDLGSDLVTVGGRLIRRLSRETRTGESASVWRALSVIEQYGSVTIGGLAQAYGSSQPAATKLASKLEAEGLVERRHDADDARISRLSLTAAGGERLAVERAIAADYLKPMMAGLSADDQRAIARTVEILSAFIDGQPGMPDLPAALTPA
ncbi:MarR family transcriptional regulator [Brevibacterium sp. BRM-1]|uniref:MarR family winged helix-turn-helix transcriptional regulator n=1 Tax=Brevibacterium sp. BRM-1 TaxID=2999062 RepID=UPI00227F3887|nr:MarR family transcriptional regulator [Brevibacterium sp. BRM-1]WAL39307.1 MarR family transcriptional regulator [Brevibacterium sp. BRM-1]